MTRKTTRPAAGRTLPRPESARLALLFLLLAASTVLLLAIAGCQDRAEQEPEELGMEPGAAAVDDPAGLSTEGPLSTEGTMTPGGAAGTGQPSAPAEGAAVVNVNLHGREIDMPRTIELPPAPAGELTFVVTNSGEHEHSFEIEGNGVEHELEAPLRPGESANLTVSLEPGTYTVYCPVGDHQEEGMETRVEITR
ncbi:MAG TPA: cupredoxin domain-containing protein [Thermoanaerobaculia bacterium]|nr:cupredoxin domain-containing protein [Thermoanaerobaculia bacterium]